MIVARLDDRCRPPHSYKADWTHSINVVVFSSRCINCCLLPSFALLFVVEIERHVKGISQWEPLGSPRHPPLHLMLLFIALFFNTIVPGQLFLNTSSSGNCLVHDACLGLLPKSNFSSKFRECRIWVAVYILVNSMQKIMGANEKWSPVMAWEEDQKVVVASCVLSPHNTCRACCQDKTPRPVARRTDWAAGRVCVEFSQEALVFAVHWYGVEIEGGRRREWRWGMEDRVERGENAGGLGTARGLEDETIVEWKKTRRKWRLVTVRWMDAWWWNRKDRWWDAERDVLLRDWMGNTWQGWEMDGCRDKLRAK